MLGTVVLVLTARKFKRKKRPKRSVSEPCDQCRVQIGLQFFQITEKGSAVKVGLESLHAGDTERGRNSHQSYREEVMQEGEMHKASERGSGTDIAGEGVCLNEQWKLNGRLRSRPQTDACGEAATDCSVVAKSHKRL